MAKKRKQKVSGKHVPKNISKYVLWFVALVLQVIGLSYVVAGFAEQLNSAFIFSVVSVLRYALGLILMMAGWELKKKWVQKA